MNIVNHLIQNSQQHPNKKAIVFGKTSITYKNLLVSVNQTASYLEKKGIKKGDRILVFILMSVDLYRIVLAIFSIGATAVFIDDWSDKKRLEQACELVQCKAFIGGFKARLLKVYLKPLRLIPVTLSKNSKAITQKNSLHVEGNQEALITLTTGSTGKPKAAIRTHAFLQTQIDSLNELIKPDNKTIALTNLPIVLLFLLAAGSTAVIPKANFKKNGAYYSVLLSKEIDTNQVNMLIMSPQLLLELSKHIKPNYNGSVDKVFAGGGPTYPNQSNVILQSFPKAEFNIVYGSTEVEPISSISGLKLANFNNKPFYGLPVGKEFYNHSVHVISLNATKSNYSLKQFNKFLLTNKEVGEILVSGPHVLNSYVNPASFSLTKIVLEDGSIWHRTGDLGFKIDQDLYLLGRVGQEFTFNNRMYYPLVEEYKLTQYHEVTKAAVFSNESTQSPFLVLETNWHKLPPSFDLDEYKGFSIHLVKRIPTEKRHQTKVDYTKLFKLIKQT